jgi:hypothetical protein
MYARPGDVLIIQGRTVGRPVRQGTVVEVRSPDGTPPYLVRWDDGHEVLTFPGPDAHVVTAGNRRNANPSTAP